ncbi:MAG: Dabb family protein [Campylobacterales bacterium]
MIVHVVMFKFKEENKKENLLVAKNKLESLLSQVPTLNSIEVGINFADEARAFDMSLYSKFNTKEDLKAYAIHPEHLKVVEFIKSVALESKVVDYEI